MKRLVIAAAVLVVAVSAGVIAWKANSRRGPPLTEDEIMKLVAERAMPSLVKTAAHLCSVPNPVDDRTVELSVVVKTLEHGVEFTEVALTPDAGAVAGAECLVKKLARTRFEDRSLTLPEDEVFSVELSVPLPASSPSY